MSYEERLKRLVGNNDYFWFVTLDNFIKETYENKDEGITALENLANDKERFVEFSKQIVQRKNDLKSVRDEFLNNQTSGQKINLEQVGVEMAQMFNYKMHAEQLFVPVLEGFQVQNDNNPQNILLATKQGFVEQLVSDGHIDDGDFEQRINLVINNTKQFMKNSGCENTDNSFIFYKDYDNGLFNFKIYVCDIIILTGNEKKVIRQFNAYFVEPRMHDFYQLSLSSGPFTVPTEQLKLGIIDLENDQTTISLDNLMKILMDNLKYKN